jgi:multidrug transporter EmrE-like cation transporter
MTRWIVFLAVAVVFNGVANVLMKVGMKDAPVVSGAGELIKHYLHSWPVMIGLFLFALNVLAYTQALTKIPLSVAYPVMVSLTGVIVIASSAFIFKEEITLIQWIGFALIVGGVICVAR